MNTPAAILAGPSLHGSPHAGRYAPVLRPPVRDGDLLPLARELGPGAVILIIDGYFGAGQALTLTEIGQAIDHGVALWGATSTGALRAVEAAPLGMRGLGGIHAAYATGVFVSDEEVCLVHDEEYRPLTVPTVNLRALARLLLRDGVAEPDVRRFFGAAAAIHYTERSVSGLRHVAASTLPDAAGHVLATHLAPAGRAAWNAKRRDAERAVDELAGSAPQAPHRDDPVPRVPDELLRDTPRAAA